MLTHVIITTPTAHIFVRCYSAASVRYLLAAHAGAAVRAWTDADDALYGTPLTQSSTPSLQTEPVAATGPAPARPAKRGALL